MPEKAGLPAFRSVVGSKVDTRTQPPFLGM